MIKSGLDTIFVIALVGMLGLMCTTIALRMYPFTVFSVIGFVGTIVVYWDCQRERRS